MAHIATASAQAGVSTINLCIRHKTTYRYREPVSLLPHRLILRPRESRDLRLVAMDVAASPAATMRWAHDVLGNTIATATFQEATDRLTIESVVQLQLDAAAWPVFDIAASAASFPFRARFAARARS